MTSPGGSILKIDPGVVHNHANGQRADADRFFDAPPPPSPGDDPDDPTKSATRDFNSSVMKSRDNLHARSHRHADTMDTAATVLDNQDQENARSIHAVAPKDQAAIFTGAVKDVTSTFTGAVQSLSAAVFAAVASTAQAGGTAINTGMTAAQSAAKMGGEHSAGAQAGIGAGGAPVAAGGANPDDSKRDNAETRPASASGAPTPLRPATSGGFFTHHNGDYANTGDRDETRVQPASMAMPGGASGLGGLGGISGASAGKATTKRLVTSEPAPLIKEDEPVEEPAVFTISGAHAVAPINTEEAGNGVDA